MLEKGAEQVFGIRIIFPPEKKFFLAEKFFFLADKFFFLTGKFFFLAEKRGFLASSLIYKHVFATRMFEPVSGE